MAGRAAGRQGGRQAGRAAGVVDSVTGEPCSADTLRGAIGIENEEQEARSHKKNNAAHSHPPWQEHYDKPLEDLVRARDRLIFEKFLY